MGAIHFSLDPRLALFFKQRLNLRIFVETGTFHGDTSAAAAEIFEKVLTIELSQELHQAAERKFAENNRVTTMLGQSPECLARILAEHGAEPMCFWLDAHWCGSPGTAGIDAQSPLLDEIRAIGTLHPDSVMVIDDARLYLATPPGPHRVADWPDLDDLLRELEKVRQGHRLMVFDDVIVFYPAKLREPLSDFVREHACDPLVVAEKARKVDRQRARRSKGLRGWWRRFTRGTGK